MLGLDTGAKDGKGETTFGAELLPGVVPGGKGPGHPMWLGSGVSFGSWGLGLGAGLDPASQSLVSWDVYTSEADLAAGISAGRGGTNAANSSTTHHAGLLFLTQTYSLVVPAKSSSSITVMMGRSANNNNVDDANAVCVANLKRAAAVHSSPGGSGGVSQSRPQPQPRLRALPQAEAETRSWSRSEADNQLNRKTASDAKFWRSALKLEGSWPAAWKRGVAYDLDTVRANIRPAVGVFKHPWDSMQVHGPRIVVAESSMDTMTLSYADVELAKDVLYGMYHDTAARGQPQVRVASRSISPPCGGQSDFVWLSARTPHGGASYVW